MADANGPQINADGTIVIQENGVVIVWNEAEGKWTELYLPDGGTYVPGEGITPNGPVTTEDGKTIVPGKDGIIETEDDIWVTPGGDINVDDNGNIIVSPGDSIKDADGNDITRGDGSDIPSGSVITPDGTIIVNDPAVTVNPDGSVTIPDGGSVIIWDDDKKDWVEVELPNGGTYDPSVPGVVPNPPKDEFEYLGLRIESIDVLDGDFVELTWTPPGGIDFYVLKTKVLLTDEWISLTSDDGLTDLADPKPRE